MISDATLALRTLTRGGDEQLMRAALSVYTGICRRKIDAFAEGVRRRYAVGACSPYAWP